MVSIVLRAYTERGGEQGLYLAQRLTVSNRGCVLGRGDNLRGSGDQLTCKSLYLFHGSSVSDRSMLSV